MATDWLEICLSIPSTREDELTTLFYDLGIPGWEVIHESVDEHLIRVWVLPESKDQLLFSLQTLPVAIQSDQILSDAPWVKDWAPERVPPFVIHSLGSPYPSVGDEEYLISLAPALAFGGGEHPTTRLCLRELPALGVRNSRVLDVGCGSGVLSIASAKLGAKSVYAVDISAIAQQATERNARASNVEVEVLSEGLDGTSGTYDLIIANILSPTLIDLAEALKGRSQPGGKLLLSGIREGTEVEVLQRYQPFTPVQEVRENGWVAIILESRKGAKTAG